MKFVADLHVHSKYSRATAKNLDLEHLYIAAQLKGIKVVATGDCTHPKWFREITEKLQPAEEGLYRLNPDLAAHCDKKVAPRCRRGVRFMLVSEISNIYKKQDKTRKNHNLVFLPDLITAQKFNTRLDAIGNISSDGRPILGLDARDLLEILLDTSAQAYLIPAHIWTPWFSLLGAKSGFNSVEACFEDLSEYIFALETGLSSDPSMNRRVSVIDRYTLVSNSDAHSAMKLGREANLFDTDLNFQAIRKAIEKGDPKSFLATIEFYPEEGKYHADGHRKCAVRLLPQETASFGGKCPVCEKQLTIGVLHRVEELADRPFEDKSDLNIPFINLIPLEDILSELLQVGPKTKKVGQAYSRLLEKNGSEFDILHWSAIESLDPCNVPLLKEALYRMRAGKVIFLPGYDGEFGKVHIFNPEERERLQGQRRLFNIACVETIKTKSGFKKKRAVGSSKTLRIEPDHSQPSESMVKNNSTQTAIHLNPEQQAAVEHGNSPLIIVAGPGTGKTRTLTQRICHLIAKKKVAAENVLAVTFTKKAATEMKSRLCQILPQRNGLPLVATFHSLSRHLLSESDEHSRKKLGIIDDAGRLHLLSEAIRLAKAKEIRSDVPITDILDRIIDSKQRIIAPPRADSAVKGNLDPFLAIYAIYNELLAVQDLCDYEDLIFRLVHRLETDPDFGQIQRNRFQYIFVDEYQDLNQGQYRIVRALAPTGTNLCVIGDPDQAIYGFRGANYRYFEQFIEDYPSALVIHLSRNYRSTETILKSSFQLIQKVHINITGDVLERTYSTIDGAKTIRLTANATERSEAVFIGRTIEDMVGGSGFYVVDFGRIDGFSTKKERSFSDFAVLYRTNDQGRTIYQYLHNAGIPCQLTGRKHLYDHRGIAALLAVIRVLEGMGSYYDFELAAGALKAGIGKDTQRLFREWAYGRGIGLQKAMRQVLRFPIAQMNRKRQQKICDLIKRLESIGIRTADFSLQDKIKYLFAESMLGSAIEEDPLSLEAYQKLIELSQDSSVQTIDWLMALALDTDTDTVQSNVEKVTLMSMHAAKGLEFPIVFIAGCEDDFIPYRRFQKGFHDPVDEDEERRLFYVAMTRAREILFLTHARTRMVFGKRVQRKISPFLIDIEEKLIRRLRLEEGRNPASKQKQLSLF
jgi:uncharacterized protein (TIGR00375 family)